jgi:hypothetical protein
VVNDGAVDVVSVTVTVGVALVEISPPFKDPYTVTLDDEAVDEISIRTREIGDDEEGDALLTK